MKRFNDPVGNAVALVTAAGCCVLTLVLLVTALANGDAFSGVAALATLLMACSAPYLAMSVKPADPEPESVGHDGPFVHPYTNVRPGLYRVHWREGGTSEVAVGLLHDGTPWMAPTNWTSRTIFGVAAVLAHEEVSKVEPIRAEAIPESAGKVGIDDQFGHESNHDCQGDVSENGVLPDWGGEDSPVEPQKVMYVTLDAPWLSDVSYALVKLHRNCILDWATYPSVAVGPKAWTVWVQVLIGSAVLGEYAESSSVDQVKEEDYNRDPLHPVRATVRRLLGDGSSDFSFIRVHYSAADRRVWFIAKAPYPVGADTEAPAVEALEPVAEPMPRPEDLVMYHPNPVFGVTWREALDRVCHSHHFAPLEMIELGASAWAVMVNVTLTDTERGVFVSHGEFVTQADATACANGMKPIVAAAVRKAGRSDLAIVGVRWDHSSRHVIFHLTPCGGATQ